MKNLKKLFSLLLALTMVLTMAACESVLSNSNISS